MGFLSRLFGREPAEPVSAETSSTQQEVQPGDVKELNTRLGSTFINTVRYGDNPNAPYSFEHLTRMLGDPMRHITELRRFARWAYYSNGTVTTAIDSLGGLHTLDYVVVAKPKKDGAERGKYRDLTDRMNRVLSAIRYKEVIRDAIFQEANTGMYVGYFETRRTQPGLRDTMTDIEIQNITELNANGANAAVISLPVDYVRIIGRRNSCYEVAFDLRYFDNRDDNTRKRLLQGMPKQIQDGWAKYSAGEFGDGECWLRLDWRKTIVTKIKSGVNDPYGVPFVVAALDDIDFANYFTNTKRRVLDSANNNIYYQTFPEGKDKGTSALTRDQQKMQHDAVKEAITGRRNTTGVGFFSLAAGTKMDSLPVDTSLLDEDNENAIKDDVNQDIGLSSVALGGSSTGNYATATLNIEIISNNVFTWIEALEAELNKCINFSVFRNSPYRTEFRILPTTFINRDKWVANLADLYSRGKGSLSAWIAAAGFNVDDYLSLMDFELEEGFEEKYPVHQTSFTFTSDDSEGNGGDGTASDGRAQSSGDAAGLADSTASTAANDGNALPSPSDTR